jgi:DNA-binding MarR family transcriptional regulator
MPDLRALFDDLVRLEITLWDAVDRRLRRDLDLPLGRAEVLRIVTTTPSCRVQDVAAALGITVGAVSKLVDRLEAADLCVRRAHPDDRRSSLLDVTDAGREAAAAADAAVRDELARRLDSLSVRDLDRVATLLQRTRASVDA